ncbi:hypothetical protein QBA36_42685 [Streptomyces stelliscabiei]
MDLGSAVRRLRLLLARTIRDVVKQAGNHRLPGPDGRPRRGRAPHPADERRCSFNEVFLSGVRVPDRLRIGRRGRAGRSAHHPRLRTDASGSGSRRKGGTFTDVLALARSLGRTDDPLVRQRLADLYVRNELRAATVGPRREDERTGGRPGPRRR